MDKEGTADISPSARFGVKESYVTEKLYKGLIELYKIEVSSQGGDDQYCCQLIWWWFIDLTIIYFLTLMNSWVSK